MKKIVFTLTFILFTLPFLKGQCPDYVTYSNPNFTFNYTGATPSGTYNQVRVTISSGKGAGNSFLLTILTNSGTTIITNNGGNSVDSTSVASKIEYYQSGSHAGLADCNTNTPLPVKLIKFKAELTDKVFLQWVTASEINNNKFEIQRSTDGNTFTKIGEVQGHGNSNEIIVYAFVDPNPVYKNTYYRLKQIDYNGCFEYSPIIICKPSNLQTLKPIIYPNPCTNEINITGATTIEMLGSTDTEADKQLRTYDTSNLSPGIYTIIIDNKAYKILKK